MKSCRMQPIVGLSMSLFLMSSVSGAASKITAIDFKGTEDPSELSIQADGPLTFEKQENAEDKQVVLELKNATISKSNSRKIDTSSFNSNVALVSPYLVKGESPSVRVVIQLRQAGTAEVTQDGNTLKVTIPNVESAASTSAAGASPSLGADATAPNASSKSDEQSSIQSSSAAPVPSAPSSEGGSDVAPATGGAQKTKLDEFVESKEAKKFTGSPVSLQVRDADVADVLRLIGEASGFNIIVGDGVKGKVTLSLIDVPWDQALDVVLHTLHLGAERSHNILRVVTLSDLTNEKLEEYKAIQAAEASAPRVTKVFPISYASLTDLQTIITKFASSTPPQAAGATPGANTTPTSAPGIVQIDARTNSLIVRDLPDQIERMKKLIEILDTQTPQVMIEAKVIEATEGFTKSLNGSLGIATNSSGNVFGSFAGGNPIDQLVGTPGVFATGADISAQSSPSGGTPNGTLGFSPSLSFLPGSPRLNALLSWGESETQVKIVASPKTVVMNKEKANIIQGTPVLVPGTTTVAGVGTVPTTTVQQANVSLSVKPTVTNDGSVLLDLTVTKDVPFPLPGGNFGIGNRNITTLVLVDSGSTLVIGGIYSMQSSHNSSGFPILRKIPILGALFGNETESTDRTELFIFVTPRILNPREAGLAG